MRLRRLRFTVRRMMIAVVVLALAIWSGRMWRLSQDYRELALHHAYGAATAEHIMFGSPFRQAGQRDGSPSRRELLYDYESDLADKYARAARYPWLPIAPDPAPTVSASGELIIARTPCPP